MIWQDLDLQLFQHQQQSRQQKMDPLVLEQRLRAQGLLSTFAIKIQFQELGLEIR